MKKLTSIILLSNLLISCFNNKSKHNVEKTEVVKYYPNTEIIQSRGNYFQGHPVGLFTTYDSLGKLEATMQYDSSGLLDGKHILFKDNGDTDQVSYYKFGKLNGITTEYHNNHISAKVFFLNDKQVGNAFYFDSLGQCNLYDFFNFRSDPIMSIDYGKDTFCEPTMIFDDSIVSYDEDIKDSNCIDLALLVSNPLNSSTTISLEQLDRHKKVIQKENLNIEDQYFIHRVKMDSNTTQLKTIGTQQIIGKRKKTLIRIRNF